MSGEVVVASNADLQFHHPLDLHFAFWCTQYRGHIAFKWTDNSVCEEGFSVRRDGKGFTQSYDYTAPTPCYEIHSPQSFYDDLTLQPSGRRVMRA